MSDDIPTVIAPIMLTTHVRAYGQDNAGSTWSLQMRDATKSWNDVAVMKTQVSARVNFRVS
jgi:hypothetical protein